MSAFAAVIGDWYSMEEAQVCLELLGPGWGLTQADAMGGWELRGLLRRVMSKTESLICYPGDEKDDDGVDGSVRRKKKNVRRSRRPSLNTDDMVDDLNRGNKLWTHLIMLCEICTDVMLMSLLQHNNDVGGEQERHMKHSPEAAFGAKTYLTRLGGDGTSRCTKSGDRSTLAMLMDVWQLLSPQLLGIGDSGLSDSSDKKSSTTSFLSLFMSEESNTSSRTSRPSHPGGCMWRIAQLEIRSLESSIERCVTQGSDNDNDKTEIKAALISAETSLRRFNALCVRFMSMRNDGDMAAVATLTTTTTTKTDDDKLVFDLSTILSVWAITRLDVMRQSIVRIMSKKDSFKQIASQIWSAQFNLLVFVRSKPCVPNLEKRLLRTVTDSSVQKYMPTMGKVREEEDQERNREEEEELTKRREESNLLTPLNESHFQPETNTSESEAGALHAAKSLHSFLTSSLVFKMIKQFNEFNSTYWSSLAKYLQERRTKMQMQLRRMYAENSLRRVRASANSIDETNVSSKENGTLRSSGCLFAPKEESRIRKDRHDTAKSWRDVRDQLRDHAVQIRTSLWWKGHNNVQEDLSSEQFQIIDTFENPKTRARFRMRRYWDGRDYADASYAESKTKKSVARVTARAAKCAMDAAAAATAEERAAFEAFCSISGDLKRNLQHERERETMEEIRIVLNRCVDIVSREYEEEKEEEKKEDFDDDGGHIDMPSRAALELHLEEMLHGEEGEDIVYVSEGFTRRSILFDVSSMFSSLSLPYLLFSTHLLRFNSQIRYGSRSRVSDDGCTRNIRIEQASHYVSSREILWSEL